MSQTTDSQPVHPSITFQVNLETVNRQGFLQPSRTEVTGNETVTEADNFRNTRTIYLPTLVGANIEGIGPNGYLKHGDTFTVKGKKALYLKNLYVTGSIDDVLQIVSES